MHLKSACASFLWIPLLFLMLECAAHSQELTQRYGSEGTKIMIKTFRSIKYTVCKFLSEKTTNLMLDFVG